LGTGIVESTLPLLGELQNGRRRRHHLGQGCKVEYRILGHRFRLRPHRTPAECPAIQNPIAISDQHHSTGNTAAIDFALDHPLNAVAINPIAIDVGADPDRVPDGVSTARKGERRSH